VEPEHASGALDPARSRARSRRHELHKDIDLPRALSHLFGSYLNEDWPGEYPQAMEAIRDFAVSEPTTAPLLHDELSLVLGRAVIGG